MKATPLTAPTRAPGALKIAWIADDGTLMKKDDVVVRFDPRALHVDAISRAIQGIIAGVGFLGGGAILKAEHEIVSGLTTAASIWLVASLGIACGVGQWVAALIALAFAMIILIVGGPVEGFVHRVASRRKLPPDVPPT